MIKKMSKEEKRQIILDSINFYRKERNKQLFKINNARLKKKQAEMDGKIALTQARLLKKKIINEVLNNTDVLTNEDKNNIIE